MIKTWEHTSCKKRGAFQIKEENIKGAHDRGL